RQSSLPEARVSAASLAGASRERLRLWDLSPQQMRALEESGQARRTLTIYSPIVGVVIEKMAVAGQRVEPGMTLYRIADLSTIWVYGDVYEYELPFVKVGDPVERHAGLDPLPCDGHLLDDDACDRRVDGERAPGLPALFERAHLLRREVPETEPLAAGARERSRGHPRLGERALP